MTLSEVTLESMPPLPLAPAGSLRVADGVAFGEDVDGNGAVWLWGMASWSWVAGDTAARRLAAVQLVNTRAARQRQVANAFGVNENSLVRWRTSYASAGVEGLVARQKGPNGPSKLTGAKRSEITSLRTTGMSMRSIAAIAGVSLNSVGRALRDQQTTTDQVVPVTRAEEARVEEASTLEPLARPVDRTKERQAARAGLISEAPPIICQGSSLPLAGALVILPALAATGLLEAATSLYATGRAAFYGLRSLILAVVFAAMLGEPRAEGLTRLDPTDAGRLLGLDRVPEVATLRRRMEELAVLGRADQLISSLARQHLMAHDDVSGIFYIDGHVRAYHGNREIPKAHVARIRLAMPAEQDTWIGDRRGDGVLVWSTPPGASLAGELRRATTAIRELVGADARPTICFDRGGWSPKLFVELQLAGFHILTYRKGLSPTEPRDAFSHHHFTDDSGHVHDFCLSDHPVLLSYDNGKRTFTCRQITRLDEASGHQTQIITTRDDVDPAVVAHDMFNRWSQENFFRYMRAHYGLDALDTYATTDDDMTRTVANPARRDADRVLKEARRSMTEAQAMHGRASIKGLRPNKELRDAFADANAEVVRLQRVAWAIPAKVPLGDVRPDAVRLGPERKRIHDAIRMASYNAESALARMLAPHYARAEDEARSLLREAFHAPADLEVIGDELHVRISPMSAPRRTRAIAGLCEELTATKTVYPGTKLTLVYAIKDAR